MKKSTGFAGAIRAGGASRWLSGERSRVAGACLLAMAAAFALYAPTLGYDFVTLDDPLYVETSRVVRDGFSWEGLKLAFTTAPENYWAPLLWMSFMFDMELSGGPPWSCHLTNTMLFSLNAGLLFLLARRWTGRAGLALATTLLWVFHPTRVESVAWVTARKDVLSGVFVLAGLWFYTAGREQLPRSASAATNMRRDGVVPASPTTNHQRSTFIALSWLCMLLGGMAKQVVLVMPAAMVLLDVWPLGRTDWDRFPKDVRRLAAEKWAFWLTAIGFAALPIWFHAERHGLMDVPIWHRALMIPVHYLFYLSKVMLPIRLMPLQPDLPSWWELLAGAICILSGLTWGAWRWRRRFPPALWGWLWFAVLLFPLSGVVWAGAERVATRWLYLPQIGLLLGAAAAVAEWIRTRGWLRRRGGWACAIVLAIWGAMSLNLSRQWRSRDQFGIWAYTCNPGHPVACMLGGDGYLSQKNWARAMEAYEAGSGFYDTHCFLRLCMIWNCCGFPELTDDAWPRFEKDLGKSMLEAMKDQKPLERIFIWRLRGQCMQARGDLDGAIGAFKEAMALELEPDAFVVAEYLRASHEAGRTNELADVAERMTKAAGAPRRTWEDLFPCYAQIWRDGARGYAYGYFSEFARRRPDDAVALNNMAWLLATAKPMEIAHAREEEWPARALEWAERVVKLDEGEGAATAWDTLGAARANAGDFSGAIEAATRGAKLAREGGGSGLALQIESRLSGYRTGLPWRE